MSLFKRYYRNALKHTFKRKLYQKRNDRLKNKNLKCKILVILHLFYPDSWKEICEYLKNLESYDYDLIITLPESLKNHDVFKKVKQFKNDVKLIPLENRGYDVAPFLYAIKLVDLKKYDIVFKLQSKGVKRGRVFIYKQLFYGRSWFVNLFEGCLGERTVHYTIDRLFNDASVGIICADNLIVNDPLYKENLVNFKLNQFGLNGSKNYKFIAGTCFAMSSEMAQKIKEIKVNFNDFDTVLPSRGISLAHAIERYFAILCLSTGHSIEGNKVCTIFRKIKKPLESLLQRFSSERILNEPYVFDDEFFYWRLDNRLITYKIKEIEVGKLKWNKDMAVDYFIKDCIPYRYLCGDKESYKEYAEYHLKTGKPLMTEERFEILIQSLNEKGYDPKHIIIVDDRNMIRDGQHRACYIAYKYGLDKKIKVMEIKELNKKQLIKNLIPRFIMKRYYTKKYGCY